MNSATKILLIVFLSLLIFSLLISGAVFLGRQLGANMQNPDLAPSPGISPKPSTSPVLGGSSKYEDYSYDFGSSPKSLDIQVHAGSFKIVEGDSFSVDAYGVLADRFTCYLEGDTLCVQAEEGDALSSYLQLLNYEPEIILTIPEGASLQEVDLSVSSGSLQFCGLSTDQFDLEMSAGTLHCEGLDCRAAELDVATGTVEILGLSVQDLQTECTAGSVQLDFLERERAFHIRMEITAGTVAIGSRSYTGDTVLGAKDAENHIELDLAAGRVVLNFA